MPRPVSNPPNPHERFHLERFEPELVRLEVSEEQILARAEGGKYAFYRGQTTHGTPPQTKAPANQKQMEQKPAGGNKQLQQSDYLRNIDVQNKEVQDLNFKAWDIQRRGDNRGVEVQKAK